MFCAKDDCALERSRGYKRAYSYRNYHSSAKTAHELNQRTVASRKKSKERKKAEAEAAAKAKAEREALERKAVEEGGRVLREREEREERRELRLLGIEALIFGANEADDLARISAKTLEVGMKWKPSLLGNGSLSTSAFRNASQCADTLETGLKRAPPQSGSSTFPRTSL